MIAAWTLLSALSLAAPIDCGPVRPAPVADPDAARAYVDVGEEELRQGRPDTAALAFREAARLDPSSEVAKARLLDVCRPDEGGEASDEELRRASRAVEDGRYGEVAALLGPRYRAQSRPDPTTALLYGIALFEQGDHRGAEEALEKARESPETADAAGVFLGLLAMRAGDSRRAASFFDRVDPGGRGGLARTARNLSIMAQREGRLSVTVDAAGGYDSNVNQAPDATPGGTSSSDVLYGGGASALFRPFGEDGPYVDAGARLRNLVLLDIPESSLGWAGGALGYRLSRGKGALQVEYGYDAVWLRSEALLFAHQFQLQGELDLWGLRWGALASARAETYLTEATAKYSGPTLEAELSARLDLGAQLWLRYRGENHQSAERMVAWLEHGPGARALVELPFGRLAVDAQLTARRYAAMDPDLDLGGDVRQDVYLDGGLSFEQDIDQHFTLYAALGGRKAFSNARYKKVTGNEPDIPLDYTRLSGSAGVIFTAGLW